MTRRDDYMDFAQKCYDLAKHPFLTEGYTFENMPTGLEMSLKRLIAAEERLHIEAASFLDKYQ